MTTLVMKFGGASVATPSHFSRCAEIILSRQESYSRLVIVVSAIKGMTNSLIRQAKEINPNPPLREYDMLVSTGERISMALLAMALHAKGKEAVSFTGSQTGIITSEDHSNAKIIDVRPFRLKPHLEAGRIVIVAGFQGVSLNGEVTTLGRGGSDTTAVALAVALQAEKVEFLKDVDGMYAEDPKLFPEAQFYPFLDYTAALKILDKGAKILHKRAVILAQQNGMPLHILPFDSFAANNKTSLGTLIGNKNSLSNPLGIYETCYASF